MSTLPDAMAQYMERMGIARERLRNGRLTLHVDDRHRVVVAPLPGGEALLEARVGPLPEDPVQHEQAIERAMRLACARMAEDAASLVLDEAGRALLLQRRVAAGATVFDFEQALESHLNALAGWKGALAGA